MIKHLHVDVCNQNKFLMNGVDKRLRFVRSKDAFCLMDASESAAFSVRIREATLIMRKAKISPGILLTHAQQLVKTTAKYPSTTVTMKAITLNAGIYT